MAKHPKRASLEAARDLHESGKLPVSEELRAMTEHDPERHTPNVEFNALKAERFAIQAHFIRMVCDEVVEGENENTRFKSAYVSYDPDEYEGGIYKGSTRLAKLYEAFMDIQFSVAERLMLEPKNQPIIQRYASIDARIRAHEDTLPIEGQFRQSDMFDKESSEYEAGASDLYSRIAAVGDLAPFIPNLLQILDYFYLTLPELKDITQEEKRHIAHQNIDFISHIASMNIVHSTQVETVHQVGFNWPTDYPSLKGFSMEQDENGEWKLRFKSKVPKPRKLMGATLGCPANYDIQEGESALEAYAHALINFAYDNGLGA